MDALHLQGAKLRGKISTITRNLENIEKKFDKLESQTSNSNRNETYDNMKKQDIRKIQHKTPYVAHNNLLTIENSELKRVCERLSKENQRKDRIIAESNEALLNQTTISSRKLREIEEERQEYIMFDQYLNAVKGESELLKEVVQKLQCSFTTNKEELSKLHEARQTMVSLVESYTVEISSLKDMVSNKKQELQDMTDKLDIETANNLCMNNNHKFCGIKIQDMSQQHSRLQETIHNLSAQLLSEQVQNKINSKIILENGVRDQLMAENRISAANINASASAHASELERYDRVTCKCAYR